MYLQDRLLYHDPGRRYLFVQRAIELVVFVCAHTHKRTFFYMGTMQLKFWRGIAFGTNKCHIVVDLFFIGLWVVYRNGYDWEIDVLKNWDFVLIRETGIYKQRIILKFKIQNWPTVKLRGSLICIGLGLCRSSLSQIRLPRTISEWKRTTTSTCSSPVGVNPLFFEVLIATHLFHLPTPQNWNW